MGFLFIHICELLEHLQSLHTRPKALPAKEIKLKTRSTIEDWFSRYRQDIDKADGVALLSALLPKSRTDKVSGIGERRLQDIVAKSDGMSESRRRDLLTFSQPGKGDLADCVERSFIGCLGPPSVTVEDVEQATLAVASTNRFSSPLVRRRSSSSDNRFQPLVNLYRRLGNLEAKWFTRLILKEKEYLPIEMPDFTVYRSYHPRLPDVLKVRAYWADALAFLRRTEELTEIEWLKRLLPRAGVKVGRPNFYQGRSVHNCIQMMGSRPMVVERKYDGEYLQLHIDVSKPPQEWIQIFSKSGKDSTKDRAKVHGTIRQCLLLGKPSCKISKDCIIEGELLVYNDKLKELSPFHKIRKHVSRSGSYLGTEQDSQPYEHEHLCIMFFDIMLLDGQSLLFTKHSERQKALKKILRIIPGRAAIVQRTLIPPSPKSAEKLRKVFAGSISRNEEGLVVKADDPYVTLAKEYRGDFQSCCVKMKKDAMPNLSDIQQFAVIGARYKAPDARKPGLFHQSARIKYTEFFLGCLENREDLHNLESEAQPHFIVIATLELSGALMADLIKHDSLGVAVPYNSNDYNSTDGKVFRVRVPPGIANGQPPTTIFKRPFVFAVKSFGFDREGNTDFETVRFPQVTKIHYDKDYHEDCVTFLELQRKAEAARAVPPDLVDIEKVTGWMDKLREADPKRTRNVVEVVEATQTTRETTQRSTQNTITEAAPGSQVSRHDYAQISAHVQKPQASPHPRTEMTSSEEDTELLLSLVREIMGVPPSKFTENHDHAVSPQNREEEPRPCKPSHDGVDLSIYRSSRLLVSAKIKKHRSSDNRALANAGEIRQRLENLETPPGLKKGFQIGAKFSKSSKASDFLIAQDCQVHQVKTVSVTNRRKRSQYFPAQFLEQEYLARAAAEHLWEDHEDEISPPPLKKQKREVLLKSRQI